jgi:hypothetical protein
MLETNDRTAALQVLRDTLNGAGVKPADRVRAAQLLLEHDAPGARQADALALSDDELLRIARGVHPRERGPAVPADDSVPSDAPTENPESPYAVRLPGGAPKRTRDPRTVLGGPKEDPQNGNGPGRSIWGPIAKKDPPVASQIEIDNTPPTPEREPEPWE